MVEQVTGRRRQANTARRDAALQHTFTGAVLEGDWKLVWNGQLGANHTKLPEDQTWELFDLVSDPAERNNLYAKQPEIATRLTKMLEEYRRKAAKPNIPPNRLPKEFKIPAVWGESE